MPRQARIKGEEAIYHIIQRGNERKSIFRDDDDKWRYLYTLKVKQEKYNFKVYCYCLMDNHVHLLIAANGADVSQFMKSINISYVIYFNRKYKRCGHLFQERFKSEIIDSEQYLLQVSKYIHLNPVKASMVQIPEEYIWSSYGVFAGLRKDIFNLVYYNEVMGLISNNRNLAIKKYKEFMGFKDIKDENYERFLKLEEVEKDINIITQEILRQYRGDRDRTIIELKSRTKLTLKEIGEYFGGLSPSTVYRIIKKN